MLEKPNFSHVPYLENSELLLILDFYMEESYSHSRQSTLETLKLSLDLESIDLCTTRHASLM
jgi:hypothetical protein